MFTTRSPPQPQTQWLSRCHALGSAAHRICQNCQQGCPTCPMPALIWGPLGSSPSLHTCPLIVYNPSSNPLFHSHPYVAQYSIRYPLPTSVHMPLNPRHTFAAPWRWRSHTMLPLPLHTRWWCILCQPVPQGKSWVHPPNQSSKQNAPSPLGSALTTILQ